MRIKWAMVKTRKLSRFRSSSLSQLPQKKHVKLCLMLIRNRIYLFDCGLKCLMLFACNIKTAFNYFHYDHLKPINSRKGKLPFWIDKGQCSGTDCSVKVILTVNSTVVPCTLTANVSNEAQYSHMSTSANSKVVLAAPN